MIVPLPYIFSGGSTTGITTVDYQDQVSRMPNPSVQRSITGVADWLITPGATNDGSLPSQPGVVGNVMADCRATVILNGSNS